MRRDRLDKAEWALAAAATFFSLLLHAAFRGSAGALWRDEVSSVELASMPGWSDVWRHLSYDSFPALYPLGLRLWGGALGAGDESWRALGMLVGLATLAGFWLRARPPLISLVLCAVSPLMIRSGDAIRPYGAGAAAFLVAHALFWSWTRRPNGTRLLAAAAAALAASHLLYQNAVLLLAISLAWAVTSKRQRWQGAGIGLACLMSLSIYHEGLAGAREMTAVLRYPFELRRLLVPLGQALGEPHAIFPLLWAALLALGLQRGFSREESRPQAAALALGILGLLFFLGASGYSIQPRYFYPLMVFAAVSLDTLLAPPEAQERERMLRLGIGAAALALTLLTAFPLTRIPQTNIDQVAASLEGRAGPKDLIVLSPWYFGVSFQRYYRGAAPWTSLPPIAPDLKLHRHDALLLLMSQPDPIQPVLDLMARTLKGGGKVWVVGGISIAQRPPEPLTPAPAGPWGWYSGPYIHGWAARASYFLQSYATNIELEAPRPRGRINPHENASVDVAWGWTSVPDPSIKTGEAKPRAGG